MVLVVRNLPASAGNIRDVGSIPGWGRFPGGGNSNLLRVFLPGISHGQRSPGQQVDGGDYRLRKTVRLGRNSVQECCEA